jgi:hypothetical protein
MVASEGPELKLADVVAQVQLMGTWIADAAKNGAAAHEVERQLFRSVLKWGLAMLKAFFELTGSGDLGETFTLPNGRTLDRLPELHGRRYVSVFGEARLSRTAYGTREGQALEFVPTDQRLSLPESEFSYILQEWDQLLGIEHAWGKSRETIATILDLKQSVDSLERMNRQMAEAVPAFQASLPAPQPDQEGPILVATIDNKGIPMVRPVDARPAGAHRTKGEKANKKQMATLGCVYSVAPHERTPEGLVATLFRDPERPQTPLPRPQQRRYWAALTRAEGGETIHAQTEVFEKMVADIDLRRGSEQTLVFLSDGQPSLETDRHAHLPVDEQTVDILDLMHVTPRLWEAAHLFHKEGSDEAEQFVRERLLKVLQGQAGRVIGGLRQMGTKQGLTGTARKRLRSLCGFLENNLHRMQYDQYLTAGYPIATGVIEGACRHVIKDRMERAGMRWKVPGAQAMLHLRAVAANDHWREFQTFRIQHEATRLYPHSTALKGTAWPIAAS